MEPKRALIRRRANQTPIKFDPQRFRLNDKAVDFGIDEAKRIKDWPALEHAVDLKLEQLAQFVAWWGAAVRKDGRPKKNGFRSETVFSESQAKKLTGIGKLQKHRMAIRLKAPDAYRQYLLGAEYLAAHLAEPDNFRALGTGNNEWHTPKKWIELARSVLGEIDLDPASTTAAQKIVRAKQFHSKEDDGLSHEWHGRVWLNPPYSAKEIMAFSNKLCHELASERTTAAIMLTHNYTDSAWFQICTRIAAAICFPAERVKFEDPDGVPCSPTQGQAFIYFGNSPELFATHFSSVGILMSPIHVSK